MDIRKPLLVMLNIWRVGADPCVCPPPNITDIIFSRVCQNEIMDEKTLPVVPSSWATGDFRAATDVAAAPQRGANPHLRRRARG